MISLLSSLHRFITRDELLDRIEAGVAHIETLDLNRDDVVDVDAFFEGMQVGQVTQFGLDCPEDAMCMLEAIEPEEWRLELGMVPGARVAGHTHLRSNYERWMVTKGTVTVLRGAQLQYRTTYRAGECFEVGVDLHAFLAGAEGVEAVLHIQKKV